MGGYRDFDVIDMTPRENHTVISDSMKLEIAGLPEDRKEKVIKLLQAKVRMLEKTMIAEMNRYEVEQAEEDRKFFLDYRADGVNKISDKMREAAEKASDNIDEVDIDKYLRKKMAQNLGLTCDENGYLVTIEEKDTVVAAKDMPDDDPYDDLTKVTLADDINRELDQLSMPVERLGNVCIVVNKKTHNIVYSNETEDTVTITFERK